MYTLQSIEDLPFIASIPLFGKSLNTTAKYFNVSTCPNGKRSIINDNGNLGKFIVKCEYDSAIYLYLNKGKGYIDKLKNNIIMPKTVY